MKINIKIGLIIFLFTFFAFGVSDVDALVDCESLTERIDHSGYCEYGIYEGGILVYKLGECTDLGEIYDCMPTTKSGIICSTFSSPSKDLCKYDGLVAGKVSLGLVGVCNGSVCDPHPLNVAALATPSSTPTPPPSAPSSTSASPSTGGIPSTGGGELPTEESGGIPSTSEDTSTPTAFTNPLDFSTVEGFLASVLNSLRTIIAILAIIFMIIGGILYITSVGNEKQITTAKHAMTYAMVGLAIGVAAPSFLKEIATILEWGATDEELTGELTEALTLAEIGLNVLNFLLSIVGVLALIMMVVGGIMYFTAAADEKQVETAKKIFKYAIYGITISLASLLIVKQIGSLLV